MRSIILLFFFCKMKYFLFFQNFNWNINQLCQGRELNYWPRISSWSVGRFQLWLSTFVTLNNLTCSETSWASHCDTAHAIFYRLQRSWAKVIFSQACVKNSVHRGGVSASVHAGIHPPGADTPPREQTPPWEADCSIRSTIGRYASYWNAFLLKECINLRPQHICQCKMNKFDCQSKMQILVRDLRALAALTVNTTHMYSPATCLHLFIHIYVLSCLLLTFCVLSDTPPDQLTVRSVPYCLSLSTYILFLRPYSIQAARLQAFCSV